MSTDQFENRATFTKHCWAIRDYSVMNKGYCLALSGLPILFDTKDSVEVELLRLTEGIERQNRGAHRNARQSLNVGVVEVFVAVIEKPRGKDV